MGLQVLFNTHMASYTVSTRPSSPSTIIPTPMQPGNLYQGNLGLPSPHDSPIRLHQLTTQQWRLLAEHLSDKAALVCGVSMRLSKGHDVVNASGVAFATPTDVFYADIPYTEQNLLHGKGELARVLASSSCVLVGFGMPRIALHLHRLSGLHVKGVELSTLFTFANRKFQTAADFASRRIHPDVDRRAIHALWYGNTVEDACLRAWLSVVYVHSLFSTFLNTADLHNSTQISNRFPPRGAVCK